MWRLAVCRQLVVPDFLLRCRESGGDCSPGFHFPVGRVTIYLDYDQRYGSKTTKAIFSCSTKLFVVVFCFVHFSAHLNHPHNLQLASQPLVE